jgi:Tfp pilus assembly PilM family ATPase
MMILDKIFEAFPTPKFLGITYAGLSISDHAIRVMKFDKKGGKLTIEKYAEKLLPPGVISSGKVNNKEELTHIIELLKDELKLDYVKVSLPEEEGYLFTAKIPMVKQNEVKSKIEAKIEENVPVPSAELIFNYKITPNPEKERLDVVVSALPIGVVDTYIEIVQGAGLRMVSLEIEPQAVARALVKRKNKDTLLIVHFGLGKASLYVVSERVVHFTSTVPLKGDSSEGLDMLSQEIKRLFTYWHTLKMNIGREDRKLEEIVICGENIKDSVSSYLSSHLEAKVSMGNVWTNVMNIEEGVPDISFNDSLKYVASVGLALPSNILIDKHV